VRRVAANLATSGLCRRLVEARALARLAGRREPSLDRLPAEHAEFWAAVRPCRPTRPRESSFAFATAAGGRLWVVHTLGIDHAAVTAVDPSTGRILTHFGVGGFGLDALHRPGDLAVASGAVWVALRGEGNIKRVDAPPAPWRSAPPPGRWPASRSGREACG
jgi:hypothetical protein